MYLIGNQKKEEYNTVDFYLFLVFQKKRYCNLLNHKFLIDMLKVINQEH